MLLPFCPTLLPFPPAFLPAEHFVAFLQRFVQHLRTRLAVNQVVSDTPASFLATLQQVGCAALCCAASRQNQAGQLGLHCGASPCPARSCLRLCCSLAGPTCLAFALLANPALPCSPSP